MSIVAFHHSTYQKLTLGLLSSLLSVAERLMEIYVLLMMMFIEEL